ncbi:unnamed protein product [Prorocentrum cordatum]|uniref:Uncharacterized protein n=1 Tax=Prorocentrum cordatum TaxID=2364126 RepID=A0ABN9SS89_9DINO|nr:unnamed protein product [Polarella glacialis]
MRAGISEFGGRRPPDPSVVGAVSDGTLSPSIKEEAALPEHHGAMLAEMGRLGVPLKPGFCIRADCIASKPDSVELWEALEPAIVRLRDREAEEDGE